MHSCLLILCTYQLTLAVAEIDRVLKKVEEGVEVFDDIWDKVRQCVVPC